VTLAGRLDDQDLATLLQSLARNGSTGKLTLTRRDGHALLAFRAGKIIYAASSGMRETFGNILVLRGLVSEADLLLALERQHAAAEPTRLGSVLVQMGKVDEKGLREVMKQQTEDVIAELVRWKTGFFKFEPLVFAPGGEVEVDIKDFLVTEGFSPQEMLGEVRPLPPPEPPPPSALMRPRPPDEAAAAPPSQPVPLGAIVPEAPSPAVTAEVTLRLMRYAAQILNRGVLFLVRPDEVRGMGQFGVQIPGRPAADQVRDTVIPLGEPSLFRDVVERRETYRGSLEDSRWNRHLIYRLGGQQPGEVVAVPMIVGGAVTVIFYGDNLPDGRPIGPVDTLEFLIAEAALAMERALVETREKTLVEKRPK
jgi:hypothetical protein